MPFQLQGRVKAAPKVLSRKFAAAFVATLSLPASLSGGYETWANMAANYPSQGLIDPQPLSGIKMMTVMGGGIDQGIIQGTRLHLHATTGYGAYCTDQPVTKAAASAISNQPLSMIFRGYMATFGLPGAVVAGVAHGIATAGQEIVSGGQFANEAPCGQMRFDALTHA